MKKIISAVIGILFIALAYSSGENDSTTFNSKVDGNTATINVNNYFDSDISGTAKVLCMDAWKIVHKNPNINKITLNITMLCNDSYGEKRSLQKTIVLDSEWMRRVEITKYKTENDFYYSTSYLTLVGDLEYFNTPCNNW